MRDKQSSIWFVCGGAASRASEYLSLCVLCCAIHTQSFSRQKGALSQCVYVWRYSRLHTFTHTHTTLLLRVQSASGAFHNGRVRRAHTIAFTRTQPARPYSFLSCRPLELLKWRALAANKCINYFNWTRTPGTSYLSQPHQQRPLCLSASPRPFPPSSAHRTHAFVFTPRAYTLSRRPRKNSMGTAKQVCSNFITKVKGCAAFLEHEFLSFLTVWWFQLVFWIRRRVRYK
jgi:hypothetical protein